MNLKNLLRLLNTKLFPGMELKINITSQISLTVNTIQLLKMNQFTSMVEQK